MNKAGRGQFVGLMTGIMVLAAALDQLTKAWALHALAEGPLHIIGDWFRFRLLFNPGAAFSMGENSTWLFSCIQLAFVVGVAIVAPRIQDRLYAIGLAMIAGGGLGNFIDRLFREPAFFIGHVVDFVSIGNFAVFNVADSFITCGVAVVFIAVVREEFKARAAHTADKASTVQEPRAPEGLQAQRSSKAEEG